MNARQEFVFHTAERRLNVLFLHLMMAVAIGVKMLGTEAML